MKKLIVIFGILILSPFTVFASSINDINQKVCNRFEDDLSKMAAIMEEVRHRKGITETRVAFGGIDDSIKSADYSITYAAEAEAFQKYQKPASIGALKSQLEVLKNKVLKAKTDVAKVLNEK